MEKKFVPPAQRIILFGQQNLQNSVLVGYIQQKIGIECQMSSQPQWRDIWTAAQRPTLALIDAEIARPERLVDLLEQIYDQALDVRVAFFSVSANHSVERMVAWPIVTGLFYADSTQQQLCKGIQALFDGEYWLPRQLVSDYLQRTRQKPKRTPTCPIVLTKREKQVLYLTATGATNTEIADKLNLSMHTIKTHIYNLFRKIDVSNRMQAVNWAKENLPEFNEFAALGTRR